jgi:thiol-disulfide isomerase/thioredoxin
MICPAAFHDPGLVWRESAFGIHHHRNQTFTNIALDGSNANGLVEVHRDVRSIAWMPRPMNTHLFCAGTLIFVLAAGCNSANPLRFAKSSSEKPQDDPASATNIRFSDDASSDSSDKTPQLANSQGTESSVQQASSDSNSHPELAQASQNIDAALRPDSSPGFFASAAKKTMDAFRSNNPISLDSGTTLDAEIASFEPFPFAFELPNVVGEKVSSKTVGRQLILVDIWATWCGPCKKAMPELVEIQKEYESLGVQVVGITCDSDDPADAPETARKAYNIGEQLNVNYPLLVDDGTTIGQIPGFRVYPTMLFLTPDGQVRYMVTGVQSKAKLAATINTVLQM